jgi:large subunit ribosomal protein L4
MPTIDVYNQDRQKVDELELDGSVFGAEVKEHLLHAAVRYQLAKRRAGTHLVKGRSDVSGGGKKPYRQKGTGRARQGSTRAPQWRGGGAVFGPVVRSYAHKLNKKVRRAALCSAISRRVEEGKLLVLDTLEFPEIKTRQGAELMKRFELSDMLVVVGGASDNVALSLRNLPTVTMVPPEGLNVYDVLRKHHLVMTRGAVEAVTARLRG